MSSTLGRKPLFSRADAYRILEARRMFGECRRTTAEFIDEMVAAEELKDRCSNSSMHRLLSGQMFPDLHVFAADGVTETDVPYPYKDLPKSKPGQPPKPERLDDNGKVTPRLTAGQRKFRDELVKLASDIAHSSANSAIAELSQQLHKRIDDLERELYGVGVRRKLNLTITPVTKE